MRRITALVALLAVAVLAASSGFAAYPERPIKMIVPWAAGGDTDVIKRVWAEAAKKHLPQPIVVALVPGSQLARLPPGRHLRGVHASHERMPIHQSRRAASPSITMRGAASAVSARAQSWR